MCTRLRWHNAKVKSDGSGSKGLTPYTACVIVAVRLSKALKEGHSKGPFNLHVPCGPLLLKIAPREMKHALKIHVLVCLYVLYRIRIL